MMLAMSTDCFEVFCLTELVWTCWRGRVAHPRPDNQVLKLKRTRPASTTFWEYGKNAMGFRRSPYECHSSLYIGDRVVGVWLPEGRHPQ